MAVWKGRIRDMKKPGDIECSYKIQQMDKTLPMTSGAMTAVEAQGKVPPPHVSASESNPRPRRNNMWPPKSMVEKRAYTRS
jgi:hypothetical protein